MEDQPLNGPIGRNFPPFRIEPVFQPTFPGLEDPDLNLVCKKNLSSSLVSSPELLDLEIKERIVLIDDWCRVADLGFIFAARGLGKTWLAMHLAHGLALCQNVGPWKVHQICKVLYVDGEMSAADIKARDAVLGPPAANLFYLNHELAFLHEGQILNLADPQVQFALLSICEEGSFTILFLDNLSTLATGVDENKTIDWEIIQPWLLKLRRAGITVIFIHHAGRNNQMRGSSKREDPASWILRLDSTNDSDEQAGAHFLTRFTKWRGASRQPKSFEWSYTPSVNGEILIDWKEAGNMNVFLNHITNGLDTCILIAEEMGVSKGYISKLATQAESKGYLEKRKGKYCLKEEA